MTSPTIDGTIWFLGKVNTVLDVCKSGNIYEPNPLKHPLSSDSPGCIEVLEDCQIWGPTIHVRNKKSGKLTKLPCFEALEGPVRGLLALHRELVFKYTSFQLCTVIYNQDSLKQLLSRLRGREEFNMNPLSRMDSLTIRILVAVKNVLSTSKGNVAYDNWQLEGELQTVIDPEETKEQRMVQYFEAGTFDDYDENVEAHYETYEKIDQ